MSQFTLPPIVTQPYPPLHSIHDSNESVIRTWFLPWLYLTKIPTHRIRSESESGCTAVIEYRCRHRGTARFQFTDSKHIYVKYVGEAELCRVMADGSLSFRDPGTVFRGQGHLHAGLTDAQALRFAAMMVLGRDPRYETGADDGIWDTIINTVLVDTVMTE